jgi:BolA-like protein 1
MEGKNETHFKLYIVSDSFNGIKLLERHRLVNNMLNEEFENGLHALSLTTKTQEEFDKINK